ncbi:hypothetical protein D3C76_1003310 [compost metagenome]
MGLGALLVELLGADRTDAAQLIDSRQAGLCLGVERLLLLDQGGIAIEGGLGLAYLGVEGIGFQLRQQLPGHHCVAFFDQYPGNARVLQRGTNGHLVAGHQAAGDVEGLAHGAGFGQHAADLEQGHLRGGDIRLLAGRHHQHPASHEQ